MEIVVTPTLDRSRVLVPGVVTVPGEMATIGCDPSCGIDDLCLRPARVQDIPFHSMGHLRARLEEAGKLMVNRLGPRGYHWLGELRFHGPFWSREYDINMTDLERSEWRQTKTWANKDGERHPEHALAFVHDVDEWNPQMDYVLIGAFVVRNTLTEVLV